jgi:hypothetical protein
LHFVWYGGFDLRLAGSTYQSAPGGGKAGGKHQQKAMFNSVNTDDSSLGLQELHLPK